MSGFAGGLGPYPSGTRGTAGIVFSEISDPLSKLETKLTRFAGPRRLEQVRFVQMLWCRAR
jgi:hypothetical protein